jgi:pantothenate kinase type III
MLTGLVERSRQQLVSLIGDQPIQIIVTGGDAHLVCAHMPGAIEVPELVLDGLQLALPQA